MIRSTTLMAVLVAFAPALVQAGTIYQEGFSGSTVMSATPAAPTATTTDYAVMSTKDSSGSSLLNLNLAAGTSAGFAEMQALFTTTPVTLSAGDCIELEMTFQGTLLLDSTSASQSLNVGLYNSGGVYPVNGGQMANAGMGSGATFVNGNAQNWEGYVGRIGSPAGSSSQIYTRDKQTDTTNENQDVLFTNAGTGAYDNPSGTTVQGGGAQINLTDATDYTLTFNIAYDGTDVTVSENVYAGVGTGGTNIYSLSGTAPAGFQYTTFDSLAFGARFSAASAPSINVSALKITTCEVPEPTSLALVGLGVLGLLVRRRRV